MRILYIHIISILAVAAFSTDMAFAQKAKKKTTRIGVEYFKSHDKGETLVAKLRLKEDRYVAFANAMVQLYSLNDTTKTLVDELRTNEEGQAIFKISDDPKIVKDSAGQINFMVEFKGNASSKESKRKITIKQADMEVSFFQKDSTKFIEAGVGAIGFNNQFEPVEGVNISFYIKGTFSLLKFGKEKTDSDGKVKIDFPIDMPGDTVGVLTIIAKIEEDDLYGTIESRGAINWGIPVPLVKEKQRGLGDTDAPLWMVYTLIILLSAVWFHYLYVIFLIVKIKLALTE